MLTPSKRRFIAKIILMCLIAIITLYCLYAVFGQLIIWNMQPQFVHVVTGRTTRSVGFMIQTFIFTGLSLIMIAADILVFRKLFIKKKVKPAPDSTEAAKTEETDNANND